MSKRFNSAVDWWYYASIIFVVIVLLITGIPLMATAGTLEIIIYMCGTLLALGLPIWLLLSTYYVISENHLIIRCGPFVWHIERSTITGIEHTRSPLSSPALSLNRLKILYGAQQSIMISPKNQTAFITMLGIKSND